jgi:hypothetical protein
LRDPRFNPTVGFRLQSVPLVSNSPLLCVDRSYALRPLSAYSSLNAAAELSDHLHGLCGRNAEVLTYFTKRQAFGPQ